MLLLALLATGVSAGSDLALHLSDRDFFLAEAELSYWSHGPPARAYSDHDFPLLGDQPELVYPHWDQNPLKWDIPPLDPEFASRLAVWSAEVVDVASASGYLMREPELSTYWIGGRAPREDTRIKPRVWNPCCRCGCFDAWPAPPRDPVYPNQVAIVPLPTTPAPQVCILELRDIYPSNGTCG